MTKELYNIDRVEKIESGRTANPDMTWPGQRPSLSTFIGPGSWLIFELLGIKDKPEWFLIPSEHWCKFDSYRKLEHFVTNLPVVNDGAERAMAMIKTYVDNVRDEEEKQDLLQVVRNFRANMPDFNKESLKNI